jgi:hypothetical protein
LKAEGLRLKAFEDYYNLPTHITDGRLKIDTRL